MDFFARTGNKAAGSDEEVNLERVGAATASCTVSVEWASDGVHVITAVLAPRMRVDNGFTMWNCLQAQVVAKKPVDELFEIGLRSTKVKEETAKRYLTDE